MQVLHSPRNICCKPVEEVSIDRLLSRIEKVFHVASFTILEYKADVGFSYTRPEKDHCIWIIIGRVRLQNDTKVILIEMIYLYLDDERES